MNAMLYTHESDRKALKALQAIPGFTPLLKAFMKVWSEKQFHIQNMSTNLRISEKQLPKYYQMLLPICEKLGIEVPELYLKLDVIPNAYTFGDTKPFIVITSGLLETVPEELVPTVLAHECGHIACHHCLYTTMGNIILSEAIELLGLSDLAILPVRMAFYYWMRCSELSADRAAAICDGNAEKTVKMCMHFAGYDKDILEEANVDAFMEQALAYREMVNDSAWNKTLEFMMLSEVDHPMNAVRAYECSEWGKTDRFGKMCAYVEEKGNKSLGEYLGELPMDSDSKHYLGKDYLEVRDGFAEMGFKNISTVKTTNKGMMVKAGQVVRLTVNGQDQFEQGDWYDNTAEIVITYYEAETADEVALAHPGQLRVPNSSKRYGGRNYTDVSDELMNAGFQNVSVVKQETSKKNWLLRDGSVLEVSINGQTQFDKDEWFAEDAVIRITYYALKS